MHPALLIVKVTNTGQLLIRSMIHLIDMQQLISKSIEKLGGAGAACHAHNLKVTGSKPVPAKI